MNSHIDIDSVNSHIDIESVNSHIDIDSVNSVAHAMIACQTLSDISINHSCKNDASNPNKKRNPLQHLKGVKSLQYT